MRTTGRMTAGWIAVGLLFSAPSAFGQSCVDDVLCVHTQAQDEQIHFFVENLSIDDITVVFEVDGSNLRSSRAFPLSTTYPGRARTYAFTLRPGDPQAAWDYRFNFWWRPALARRESCAEDLFCIVTEERAEGVEVYLENRQPFEVSVSLEMEVENGRVDRPLPHVASYPPNQRTRMAVVERIDPFRPMNYPYTYHWRLGSVGAIHDEGAVYALPYGSGKTFRLVQGYHGGFTHQDTYALDWSMPERTPVLAARRGVVAYIEDRHEAGGTEDRFRDTANMVILRHDDGTLGNYVHLARNGVFVRLGQRVAQGQVIGVSGNTGFSSGPHLHFEVFTIQEDLSRRTLPVRFRLANGQVAPLVEGRSYTARDD